MPKQRKENQPEKEPAKEAETKHSYEGFRGALDVDLSKSDSEGVTLRDKLSKHVKEVLEQELRNQQPRLDMMKTWEDNYSGHKPPKEFPWSDSANVCTPVTRSNTDAVHVRLVDAIFNSEKFGWSRPDMRNLSG